MVTNSVTQQFQKGANQPTNILPDTARTHKKYENFSPLTGSSTKLRHDMKFEASLLLQIADDVEKIRACEFSTIAHLKYATVRKRP